ncbi:hypothetical protein NUW54_g5162 [Trametes sanguinea]|uniref:Uncharacterized protein n=1 Tax=Trametes sanguinea TaxID=158606 RepID=A0ACC1PWX0_9APHY|nr:hypothetical protein NUW54_g5162 [Trametes sanguinea]
MKDVCLPFTEITSSKQLVELLFDCVQSALHQFGSSVHSAEAFFIAAHSLAYTRHQLLHRDISAGNVIILPSLSSGVGEDGQKVVTWNGVLTDWELAKRVPVRSASDSDKPKEVPTQPERTGTWQFMSVAYVRYHPYWPVSVADELESFFHVLLFYAVRLLRHNIDNVPMFVAQYFDGFIPGARRKCSPVKSFAMDHGIIDWDDAALQFFDKEGSPHSELNKLIGSLLRHFRARYAVIRWESYKSGDGRRVVANTTSEPAPIKSGPSVPRNDRFALLNDDDESMELESPIQAEDEPSETVKTLAKQLDSHHTFRKMLANAVNPDRKPKPPIWPENDVVEDRIPDRYDPRALISVMNQGFSATALATSQATRDGPPPRKKMRTDLSEPVENPVPVRSTRARTVGGSSGNSARRGKSAKAKGKGRARD